MADREFKIKISTTAEGDGAQRTADSLQGLGAAGNKSAEGFLASHLAALKASVSHEEFHKIIKGLKIEFPELAHIAHLFLNPITASVGAGAAAFALYQNRVRASGEAFSALQLPDLPALNPGRISAAAKAWENFHKVLEKSQEAFDSVGAAAGRATTAMDAHHAAQEKVLAGQKALELANLEANKAGMTDGQYQRSRLDIEQRYGQAGLAEDLRFMQQKQSAKEQETKDHAAGAAFALAKAAGMKLLPTKEQDEATGEQLKARAEAAQKDIEQKREQSNEISRRLDGVMSIDEAFEFDLKHAGLSGEDLRQQQAQMNASIGSDQVNVDRYNAWQIGLPQRENQRRDRARLMERGAAETGAFENGASDLGASRGQFNEAEYTAKISEGMASTARILEAFGKVFDHLKTLSEEMNRKAASGEGISAVMLGAYAEDRATLAGLGKQIIAIRKATPVQTQ